MADYTTAPPDEASQEAKPAAVAGSEELLNTILRQFEDSFDNTFTERARSEQCRDYYDGIQWTAEEIEVLRKRKQPVVTANRIAPKINSLIGFEKRQRTDPKAYPRTPKHQEDAEAATDALRFVCDKNNFSGMRSNVAENLFIEGIGAICVGIAKPKGDTGQMDVTFGWVPWDRFYRDPHSRERDFSDATFMGEVLWMDGDQAKAEFKGKEVEVDGAYTGGMVGSETFDDRPKVTWSDAKRDRVRILKHRWNDPDKGWMTAIVCRGGFLWGPKPSPYLDEDGSPSNDLIAVSAYVTRENERYGVAATHISVQDEVNKRRSKALHRLAMNQTIAEHGAVEDVAKTKAELAKPDGYIEVNKDFRFEPRDGLAAMQGEMQLLAEAKAEIDTSGVNPSLQGDMKAPSGRAQEIQQSAALSEYAVAFDALRDWSWRVYKATWCRIRQYWDGETWVRVTDDESNVRFVGLNRPVTAAEEVQTLTEQGKPVPPELQMLAQFNPQQVVRIAAPVASLDVDIIVEDGPDTVTIQGEQFEQLVELKKADPASIPTEMVIEASNLRNKEKILEHLKAGGVPPEVQKQMQEAQAQIQELQQKLQAAQQAQGAQQTEQIKAMTAQFEAATERFDAETKRMQAETERLQALQPQIPPVNGAPVFQQ